MKLLHNKYSAVLTSVHPAPGGGFPQSVTHPVPPELAPNPLASGPRVDTPRNYSPPRFPAHSVGPPGRCRIFLG